MKILVVGCGDLGMRVAASHAAVGAEVLGVVRSAAGVARLAAAGIRALAADLDNDTFALPPDEYALVYHFAPPPPQGDSDPRIRRLLATPPQCKRLVYVSTTAVYGDHQGAWIDETTPTTPGTDRGRRRLDAEMQVRAWGRRVGAETVVLRVAAIWGPGRGKQAAPRPGAVAVPVNRIHIDDLADICIAAGARAPDGATYDCADGHPTETGYMDESKRVRAIRIREELGVTPRTATQP